MLADDNRAAWFLDPVIVEPNPTHAANLEPLLVNDQGLMATPSHGRAVEIDNLFLAPDYVQTYTDRATM